MQTSLRSVLVLFVLAAGLVQGSIADEFYGTQFPCDTCGPSHPHVKVSVDALYLYRDDSVGGDFLFDNVTGQPMLQLDDFLAEWEEGFRVGLRFYENDGRSWEIVGFGMDHYEQAGRRESGNGITFPFFSGVPATPETAYDVEYKAQFQGLELNFRRPITDRLEILAGARFIESSEGFDIKAQAFRGFFSAVDNDLYGAQIGADARLFRVGIIDIATTVKGGIFYNNANVYAEATTGGAPIRFYDDEDTVAFAGELQLGGIVPMGPQASLRFGYQLFYLDGIGLAPNQSNTFDIFTASGTLDESSLLYHGAFLGFDIFW